MDSYKEYNGQVFLFQDINTKDFEIIKSEFKEYWKKGYSPIIGADKSTYRPEPEGHRHIHMKPDEICEKWEKWSRKTPQKIKKPPTSDRGLCYFVDNKRNAYIFLYIDDGLHDFLDSIEFKNIVESSYGIIYKNDIVLMNFEEQEEIFSDKWIKINLE